VDLIEPAKSVGQKIGENVKGFIDSIKGEGNADRGNSKRETWSNIIMILSIILFVASILLSKNTIQSDEENWYGIGGILLNTQTYLFQG